MGGLVTGDVVQVEQQHVIVGGQAHHDHAQRDLAREVEGHGQFIEQPQERGLVVRRVVGHVEDPDHVHRGVGRADPRSDAGVRERVRGS